MRHIKLDNCATALAECVSDCFFPRDFSDRMKRANLKLDELTERYVFYTKTTSN